MDRGPVVAKRVSIRPQFANRRKPRRRSASILAASAKFQSAPSSQTGGNVSTDTQTAKTSQVSIRPQFANRRKQGADRQPDDEDVSIRPQFANRRKHGSVARNHGRLSGFNPPPVRKPEETRTWIAVQSSPNVFQSAPSSQTGGNMTSQPFARAACKFQSAPSSQTGGNTCRRLEIIGLSTFQSAPSSQTGGNPRVISAAMSGFGVSIRPQFANRRKLLAGFPSALPASFNPPPVRKPEETIPEQENIVSGDVSIRPQFANRRKLFRRGEAFGIVLSFNPPPVRKPEETPACRPGRRPWNLFQSAPSSQTGGNAVARSSSTA